MNASAKPGAIDESAQHASALPWHEALAAELAASELPAATMLVGRIGDGLEHLCLDLAGRFLLREHPEGMPMLAAGTHPDLLVVRRQAGATGKLRQEIVIEQARQLITFMQLSPRIARVRIGVIIPADRLNRNAANALLKLFEEPAPSGHFILGTATPERLPATVRSRMRTIHVPPPPKEVALAWLKQNKFDDPQDALAGAAGAPLDASDVQEFAVARQTFVNFALGKLDIIAGARQLIEIPAQQWLGWAQAWAHDLAAGAQGLPPRTFAEDAVREACDRLGPSPMALLDMGRELEQMRRLAQHAVNNRQLLERVGIRLQGLLRG